MLEKTFAFFLVLWSYFLVESWLDRVLESTNDIDSFNIHGNNRSGSFSDSVKDLSRGIDYCNKHELKFI